MRTEPNDSAHPTQAPGQDPRNGVHIVGGLTKREYFAAMAMQGFCQNQSVLSLANEIATLQTVLDKPVEPARVLIAEKSIEFADALIAALNK